MAAISSANVRLVAGWTEGDMSGKRRKCLRVEVYNATVAAADGGMPASAFGLTCVEESTPAYYKGGGGALITAPTEDGSYVNLYSTIDGATAAVASQGVATTPNGLYFTVKGY
jgi:hypothetical protein